MTTNQPQPTGELGTCETHYSIDNLDFNPHVKSDDCDNWQSLSPVSGKGEGQMCPECGHPLCGDGQGKCAEPGCDCEADRPVRARERAEKTAREYAEHFIGQYAGLHGESRTISDEEEIEFVAKFFLKFADIIERAYAEEERK